MNGLDCLLSINNLSSTANKMRLLLLAITLVCCLCASAQKLDVVNVHVIQIPSEEQITVRHDVVENCIWAISFPFEYKLWDQTPEGTWVRGASYYYAAEFIPPYREPGWTGISHWMKLDGEYKTRPYPNELNGGKYPTPTYLLVRSRHNISETSDIQDSLAPYLQKIKDSKIYPLPIGTLREFKARHPQLTERFLKGDSVSIRGHNKQRKRGEWIDLPVEY